MTNSGVKDRLLLLIKELGLEKAVFERKIGLSNGFVDKATNNIRSSSLDAIVNAYPNVNRQWIKDGEGDMFVELIGKERIDSIVEGVLNKHNIEYPLKIKKTYPLIPIEAVAGFGDDNNGVTYEHCEQYQVPDFEAKGLEFLIRMGGTSMYPKYNSGDVLACRKIKDLLFFQWGKVYVIDSSQGQLVKRILEDKTNPDNIICVSDNKEKYPPFAMPKSDIRGVSLVLGAIKLD